jgi:hypothetical protein
MDPVAASGSRAAPSAMSLDFHQQSKALRGFTRSASDAASSFSVRKNGGPVDAIGIKNRVLSWKARSAKCRATPSWSTIAPSLLFCPLVLNAYRRRHLTEGGFDSTLSLSRGLPADRRALLGGRRADLRVFLGDLRAGLGAAPFLQFEPPRPTRLLSLIRPSRTQLLLREARMLSAE